MVQGRRVVRAATTTGAAAAFGGARAQAGQMTPGASAAVSPRAATRGADALPFAGRVAAPHPRKVAGALALPAVPAAALSAASLREIQFP